MIVSHVSDNVNIMQLFNSILQVISNKLVIIVITQIYISYVSDKKTYPLVILATMQVNFSYIFANVSYPLILL